MVCFDPLDGSSNIDCLVSIGSIFAIYKKVFMTLLSIKNTLLERQVMASQIEGSSDRQRIFGILFE